MRIIGLLTICEKPSTPSMANQMNMMGPNDSPTALVPNFCTKKRPVMMTMTIGITGIRGLTLVSPSTAETMVMDGVMTPSASRVEPPMMAKKKAHLARLRISAKSENMPPSPLLSARSVMMIYLTVV